MNIYLLTREDCSMDEVGGFVIAAPNPHEARRLAMLHHMDEGAQMWVSSQVTVQKIGDTTRWNRPHLIMRDDWGV